MALIVVASLALALGIFRMKRQRDHLLQIAETHAVSESSYRMMESLASKEAQRLDARSEQAARRASRMHPLDPRGPEKGERVPMPGVWRLEAERERMQAAMFGKSAAYHGSLKEKYALAASHPWHSIEPDTPPPDNLERAGYWSDRAQYTKALAIREEAIRADPTDYLALNDLAWLLSTCPEAKFRDGKRAVELATHACNLSNREEAIILDTLAAAHAEIGDFTAAVMYESEAIGLLAKGDPKLVNLQARLGIFKERRPYRDGTTN